MAAAFPAAAAGGSSIYHTVTANINSCSRPLAERLGEESIARAKDRLHNVLFNARSGSRYSESPSICLYFRRIDDKGEKKL